MGSRQATRPSPDPEEDLHSLSEGNSPTRSQDNPHATTDIALQNVIQVPVRNPNNLGRTGPLDEEERREVAEVRKIKACESCRKRKIKCRHAREKAKRRAQQRGHHKIEQDGMPSSELLNYRSELARLEPNPAAPMLDGYLTPPQDPLTRYFDDSILPLLAQSVTHENLWQMRQSNEQGQGSVLDPFLGQPVTYGDQVPLQRVHGEPGSYLSSIGRERLASNRFSGEAPSISSAGRTPWNQTYPQPMPVYNPAPSYPSRSMGATPYTQPAWDYQEPTPNVPPYSNTDFRVANTQTQTDLVSQVLNELDPAQQQDVTPHGYPSGLPDSASIVEPPTQTLQDHDSSSYQGPEWDQGHYGSTSRSVGQPQLEDPNPLSTPRLQTSSHNQQSVLSSQYSSVQHETYGEPTPSSLGQQSSSFWSIREPPNYQLSPSSSPPDRRVNINPFATSSDNHSIAYSYTEDLGPLKDFSEEGWDG